MDNNFNGTNPNQQQPQQPEQQQYYQQQQQPQQPVQQQYYQQPQQPQQPVQQQYYQQQPEQQQYYQQPQQPGQPVQQQYYQQPQQPQQPVNYSAYTAVGATAAAKSKLPVIIGIIVVLTVAICASAIIFLPKLLSGGGRSSSTPFGTGGSTAFERAERNSFNSMASGITSIFSGGSSSEGSIRITPSSELLGLAQSYGLELPDIGTIRFNYESILENGDMYLLVGADAMGIQLSTAMWFIERQMIMNFPELSDYFIVFDDMEFDDLADNEELIIEIGKVIINALNEYFAMTRNAELTERGKSISLGGLDATCDVYEVVIDGEFLLGLAKAFINSALDSDILMDALEEAYASMDDWTLRSYGLDGHRTAREALLYLRSEIDNIDLAEEGLDEIFAYMYVYISGNDVVRRVFVIAEDGDDVRITYTNIKKGGSYAFGLEFLNKSSYTWDDGDSTFSETKIRFINDGATARGGASTGRIRFTYDSVYKSNWSGSEYSNEDSYSFTINYEDFKVEKNGLFGGSIKASIPIPGTMLGDTVIEFVINSEVSGDTQNIRGSASFAGMKLFDYAIENKINTGKSIKRPRLTPENTLDPTNMRDMEKLGEDIMNKIMNMDVVSDLLESFGGLGFGGGYNDYDYDWGDPWGDECAWNCECSECWWNHDWECVCVYCDW